MSGVWREAKFNIGRRSRLGFHVAVSSLRSQVSCCDLRPSWCFRSIVDGWSDQCVCDSMWPFTDQLRVFHALHPVGMCCFVGRMTSSSRKKSHRKTRRASGPLDETTPETRSRGGGRLLGRVVSPLVPKPTNRGGSGPEFVRVSQARVPQVFRVRTFRSLATSLGRREEAMRRVGRGQLVHGRQQPQGRGRCSGSVSRNTAVVKVERGSTTSTFGVKARWGFDVDPLDSKSDLDIGPSDHGVLPHL